VSEGVVAVRIATHDAPSSARGLLDVGPSYVIVGCAAAVIAWSTTSRPLRVVVAVAITPLFIFTAWRLPQGRVDAMGHMTAFVVGVAWAWWKRRAPSTGQEVAT
jgi:membrane associated rhomboid family serine protease